MMDPGDRAEVSSRGKPRTARAAAPVEPPPKRQARTPGPILKERAVNMSVYLLPDDHRRLRMLAAAEETSIQSLIMDGIDAVLKGRGKKPVTRWEARRKVR